MSWSDDHELLVSDANEIADEYEVPIGQALQIAVWATMTRSLGNIDSELEVFRKGMGCKADWDVAL